MKTNLTTEMLNAKINQIIELAYRSYEGQVAHIKEGLKPHQFIDLIIWKTNDTLRCANEIKMWERAAHYLKGMQGSGLSAEETLNEIILQFFNYITREYNVRVSSTCEFTNANSSIEYKAALTVYNALTKLK